MKKTLLILSVLLVAVVISGCTKTAGTTNTQTTTNSVVNTQVTTNTTAITNAATSLTQAITISNFAFDPAMLTVTAGTKVTWTNNDSATHTVVSSAFNSGSLATGASYSFTFSTPGTYQYSCGVHPSMQGTIIVQ